jgi:aspartate 1-decarboxylase
MLRKLLRSKIHRAVITEANLEYEGSITIPAQLMEAAGLVEHEAVNVWNVTRGTRLETYVIRGEYGSNNLCMNGPAAHLAGPGDVVVIAAFGYVDDASTGLAPKIVFVDEQNGIKEIRLEKPATIPGKL